MSYLLTWCVSVCVWVYQHDSACMSVYLTVSLYHYFFIILMCVCGLMSVCVHVCSSTLYSAVVLLVSIKFRFILSYSSIWYETQRQDSLSGLANKKQTTPCNCVQVKNKLGLKENQTTNTHICPENYSLGFDLVFSLDVNCQSILTAL